MINYEYPPIGGGGAPATYEKAKSLVERGNTVDVVTMSYKGLPKFETVEGINIYRVPSIRAKKEMCSPHEMLSFVFGAKHFLRKHLKKNKYDFCHCHFIIPSGLVASWVKKKYGIPYRIKAGGSDVPGYNPDRFKLLHKFTLPMLKNVCSNSNQIVTPSRYLADLIKKNIGNYKIKIIPNGVFTDHFVPQKKKKVILSTGRLLERKGFQYLIKAVSDTDIGYEVHIAGDGPMMAQLKQLAAKSKTKIVFHGWVNNKSKLYKDLLETASIYVLASEKENASISLLEGMSAGCAMITTNISGCPETVGEAGLLFTPRNVKELKEKIDYFVEDGNRIVEYGKKARERLEKYYDWEKIIKDYEAMPR
mgnify:CR=1 FL=1